MDDIYTRIGSVASPLRYLVSKAFYVGGIAHQGRTLALENEVSFDRWNRSTEQFNQQASSMSRNFYGCLRKVNRINFFFSRDLKFFFANANNKRMFVLILVIIS